MNYFLFLQISFLCTSRPIVCEEYRVTCFGWIFKGKHTLLCCYTRSIYKPPVKKNLNFHLRNRPFRFCCHFMSTSSLGGWVFQLANGSSIATALRDAQAWAHFRIVSNWITAQKSFHCKVGERSEKLFHYIPDMSVHQPRASRSCQTVLSLFSFHEYQIWSFSLR